MKTTEQTKLAINAINAFVGDITDDGAKLIAAKCRSLIAGYSARWANAGYVPVEIEKTVVADLYNPDTSAKSRSFRIAGKKDVVTQYLSKRFLFDAKTTSQDVEDPNASYWRQLVIESQPTHYMLIDWLNGLKCDGAVWDVVRKPTISPRKLTKAEVAHACANQSYCDMRISDESVWSLQTADRETLEMYEARLTKDCVSVRPQWYFQRRSIPRLDEDILEYAQELWQHSQDILSTRAAMREHARNDNIRLPVRNSGACMLYGSPCQFLGICSGYDRPDSDKWRPKDRVHEELPELDGDGRDVLTNSRIRCFQTCRRKHYYQYELGIERQDEEEREALFFGRLWHIALEAWWTFLLKENCNVNSNSESAGSELANHDCASVS